jgi:type II secretory pathway component PulK
LTRLLQAVTDLSEETGKELVDAMIDWREFGQSEAGGFLSDAYYENLKFPYPQKKAAFETLDELFLIRGMTPAVYRQVSPFVTIYGNGRVNVNTAPKAVLLALGMTDSLVEKILFIRRGRDGREATTDDFIFPSGSEAPMMRVISATVEPEEAQYVMDLYAQKKIGMESSHYMIHSRGYLSAKSTENKDLACVFDVNSGKIKYWRE